jgi:hypothetical protein
MDSYNQSARQLGSYGTIIYRVCDLVLRLEHMNV